MKKLIIGILLICAFWIALPYYFLYQLRHAIEEGDEIALESLVDWQSVRGGLKGDLMAALASSAANASEEKDGDKLANGIMLTLGPLMIDKLVDAYVTPQGLAKMINGERPAVPKNEPITTPEAKETEKKEEISSKFDDLAERVTYAFFIRSPLMFLLELTDPKSEDKKTVGMLLQFQNGGWELTRLILPAP